MLRPALAVLALLLCAGSAAAQGPESGTPPQTGEPPRAPPPLPPDTVDLATVPDEGPVVELPAMLELADAHSVDLAVARERIAQADTSVRRAWAGVTPRVTAAGTYTINSAEAKL